MDEHTKKKTQKQKKKLGGKHNKKKTQKKKQKKDHFSGLCY